MVCLGRNPYIDDYAVATALFVKNVISLSHIIFSSSFEKAGSKLTGL